MTRIVLLWMVLFYCSSCQLSSCHSLFRVQSICQLQGLSVRGGRSFLVQSSSEEEYDEDDSEEDEQDSTGLETQQDLSPLIEMTKTVALLATKIITTTVSMASRAIMAAFQPSEQEDDDDEDTMLIGKVMRVLGRMWNAAWDFRSSVAKENDDNDDDEPPVPATTNKGTTTVHNSKTKKKTSKPSPTNNIDFGAQLAKLYKIQIDSIPTVLDGSLSDALQKARSQARLLVVLVPSSNVASSSADQQAMESFLSSQVAIITEKRARKRGNSATGSFLLWAATPGSNHAATAIKRLQTKTSRPLLAVIYPARIQNKIVPRLLAQHHCQPPPNADTMATWLNALRKRHAPQYATMQAEVREVQIQHERTTGFQESMQSDRQKQVEEQQRELERIAQEQAEQERQQAILQRRSDLLEALPRESTSSDAITIALRFADGTSGQRKFDPDTQLSVLFNWVDAQYELERETVVLTTLNGQKSFEWLSDSDISLRDAGLSKLTGLRVTQKKVS